MQIASLFGIDTLAKASSFLLLPIYLRLMTQEEYGLYSYALSFISTIASVTNLSFYAAQSKLFHEYDQKERREFSSSMLTLLIAANAVVALAVFLPFIKTRLIEFFFKGDGGCAGCTIQSVWPLLSVGILTTVMSGFALNLMFTSERFRIIQAFNGGRILLVNGVVVALLFLLPGRAVPLRLAGGFLIEGALVVIVLLLVKDLFSTKIALKYIVRALPLCLPLTFSALVNTMYSFSDRFFLQANYSFAEMAVYNFSSTFSGILFLAFSSYHNVWLPKFFKEKDLRKNISMNVKATLALVGLLTGLSLAIIVGLKVMLALGIFKPMYSPAVKVLIFQCFSVVISAVTSMVSDYLTYFEKLHITALISVAVGLLSLFCNHLLVPKFASIGAALSVLIVSMVSMALYFTASAIIVKRKLRECIP